MLDRGLSNFNSILETERKMSIVDFFIQLPGCCYFMIILYL